MKPTKCRECGLMVIWKYVSGIKGQKDSWQCYNRDGITVHWDLCSKTRFDAIKKTGEAFDYGTEKGYYTDLKPSGIQFTFQSSGVVPGSKPFSGQCKNCMPPWEVCEKCPDKLEVKNEHIKKNIERDYVGKRP